jgi:3-dehydroquinate synthase
MEAIIYRCAELHVDHIVYGGDPFEFGAARPLDFGHWAAHKLEQLSEFRIRHGEAVAIGMALDVTYSNLIGWLDAPSAERILIVLERLGFHLGGDLTVTLLRDIGVGVETHDMDEALIREAIRRLHGREPSPFAEGAQPLQTA